jgi:hypothetical protein
LKKIVFPNPATNELHVSLADFNQSPDEVSIYSLQGALISTLKKSDWKSSDNLLTISLNTLPAGTYNLIFTSSGRAVGFSKFQRGN